MTVDLRPSIRPTSGVVGLPSGQKGRPRFDFDPNKFFVEIEQKGYRLAWSRAAPCPCEGVNDQTDQPDPTCELCHGHGHLYFAPQGTIAEETVGELTDVQQAIVGDSQAAIVKGVITRLDRREDPDTKIGPWAWGEAYLTVRPENKLGYYDRVVSLDTQIVYAETLDAQAEALGLGARYPIAGVNLLRSIDAVYVAGVDFGLDSGRISWVSGRGPVAGTRLSIHYLCHPTWLIVDHPHVTRMTLRKTKIANPTTPEGTPVDMPIQAHIQYEFLARA